MDKPPLPSQKGQSRGHIPWLSQVPGGALGAVPHVCCPMRLQRCAEIKLGFHADGAQRQGFSLFSEKAGGGGGAGRGGEARPCLGMLRGCNPLKALEFRSVPSPMAAPEFSQGREIFPLQCIV